MSKLNKILIILFVIALISLPIYIYKQKSNSFNYNGYKFIKTNDNTYDIEIYFKNDINPHYISSRYSPKELDRIMIEPDLKNKVLKKEIYITLTPNLTSTSVVALAEISKITSNKFLYNIPTTGALTYSLNKNPVKTCRNANNRTTIILLKLDNQTKVSSQGDCVIVSGTDEDEIIRAGTRLTLTMLGIMK